MDDPEFNVFLLPHGNSATDGKTDRTKRVVTFAKKVEEYPIPARTFTADDSIKYKAKRKLLIIKNKKAAKLERLVLFNRQITEDLINKLHKKINVLGAIDADGEAIGEKFNALVRIMRIWNDELSVVEEPDEETLNVLKEIIKILKECDEKLNEPEQEIKTNKAIQPGAFRLNAFGIHLTKSQIITIAFCCTTTTAAYVYKL